jgi:hypothetical protein
MRRNLSLSLFTLGLINCTLGSSGAGDNDLYSD